MNLAQISLSVSDISGIIQAFGVVMSLIYVALQVRDNTRAIKGATYQSIISAYAEIEARISQDPETARIYRQGCKKFESLTEDEALRFTELVCSIFNLYENVHYQYRNNLLDEALWSGWSEDMRIRLKENPGLANFWREKENLYNKDFRKHVNRQISLK